VVVERGDTYFREPSARRNHLRLGFAAIPVESIDPGIRALAGVLREHLAERA
jgi:GntR family transcriptional regulator/MocR family aminotransferase